MQRSRDRKGVFLSSLTDRRATLQQLQQTRADALAKLNELLERQAQAEKQECARLAAERELELLTLAAQQKTAEVECVRKAAAAEKEAMQTRNSVISLKSAHLSTARLSVAPLVLPQELRTHEMAALHAWLGLLSEQRSKMAQLLDILPLRVAGLRSAPSLPAAPVPIPTPPHQPNASTSGAVVGSSGSTGPHTGPRGTPETGGGMHSAFAGSGRYAAAAAQDGVFAAQSGVHLAAPHMPQAGGGISVSLCGIRLPDDLSSAQTTQQTQALCAVLGYSVLLLDLAAAYMGTPLLHEGSFQGSTSVVWQQQTFWDRRPGGSHAVLPLFIEPGLVAAAVAPLALSAKSGKASSSSGWAALPLVRALTSMQSGAASASTTTSQAASMSSSGALGGFLSGGGDTAGGGGRSESGTGASGGSTGDRKHTDFKLAFEMLQRSCLCLVRHCGASMAQAGGQGSHSRGLSTTVSGLGPSVRGVPSSGGYAQGPSRGSSGGGAALTSSGSDALPLPLSWSAWGCLVVLFAAVLQESIDTGGNSGVSSKLGGVLPAATLAVRAETSAVLSKPPGPCVGQGPAHEDVAEEDGWDVVQTVLPPPPSSSLEDVEHYARALGLGDRTSQQPANSLMSRALSLRGNGRGSGGGGTAPSPPTSADSSIAGGGLMGTLLRGASAVTDRASGGRASALAEPQGAHKT